MPGFHFGHGNDDDEGGGVIPSFGNIEEAHSWANTSEGATILEGVFEDGIANGVYHFSLEDLFLA